MKERTFLLNYLGKTIKVTIDRPKGSKHPKHGFNYPVNYGYLPGTKAPDGEEIDAYVLGIDSPLEEFKGKVIAVVHRLDDPDDKIVVVPNGVNLSDKEIEKKVKFQEQWFKHKIVR